MQGRWRGRHQGIMPPAPAPAAHLGELEAAYTAASKRSTLRAHKTNVAGPAHPTCPPTREQVAAFAGIQRQVELLLEERSQAVDGGQTVAADARCGAGAALGRSEAGEGILSRTAAEAAAAMQPTRSRQPWPKAPRPLPAPTWGCRGGRRPAGQRARGRGCGRHWPRAGRRRAGESARQRGRGCCGRARSTKRPRWHCRR